MAFLNDEPVHLDRLIVSSQLVLSMLAMGAHHRPREFFLVFRYPRSFVVGLGCQVVLVPMLALTTVHLAGMNPALAMGVFLIAAMPGGPFSALLTHLGKGNTALAVTLTLFTTLVSFLTVPSLLWLMSAPSSTWGTIPFAVVAREVVVYLLMPLLVGMFVLRRFRIAPNLVRWGVRLASMLLLIYVVKVLAQGRINPISFGWGPPCAIIIFCVLAQQLSMAAFRIFGWPREDRLAVGIEMTVRDINLALLLHANLDAPVAGQVDPTLFAILFYGGTSLVAALISVMIFRLLGRRNRMGRITADKSEVQPSPVGESPN